LYGWRPRRRRRAGLPRRCARGSGACVVPHYYWWRGRLLGCRVPTYYIPFTFLWLVLQRSGRRAAWNGSVSGLPSGASAFIYLPIPYILVPPGFLRSAGRSLVAFLRCRVRNGAWFNAYKALPYLPPPSMSEHGCGSSVLPSAAPVLRHLISISGISCLISGFGKDAGGSAIPYDLYYSVPAYVTYPGFCPALLALRSLSAASLLQFYHLLFFKPSRCSLLCAAALPAAVLPLASGHRPPSSLACLFAPLPAAACLHAATYRLTFLCYSVSSSFLSTVHNPTGHLCGGRTFRFPSNGRGGGRPLLHLPQPFSSCCCGAATRVRRPAAFGMVPSPSALFLRGAGARPVVWTLTQASYGFWRACCHTERMRYRRPWAAAFASQCVRAPACWHLSGRTAAILYLFLLACWPLHRCICGMSLCLGEFGLVALLLPRSVTNGGRDGGATGCKTLHLVCARSRRQAPLLYAAPCSLCYAGRKGFVGLRLTLAWRCWAGRFAGLLLLLPPVPVSICSHRPSACNRHPASAFPQHPGLDSVSVRGGSLFAIRQTRCDSGGVRAALVFLRRILMTLSSMNSVRFWPVTRVPYSPRWDRRIFCRSFVLGFVPGERDSWPLQPVSMRLLACYLPSTLPAAW